jgi:hypothetical protein
MEVLSEFILGKADPGLREPEIAFNFDVVTLSAISLISAIEQQAKSLKSHASACAVIGEFRSI